MEVGGETLAPVSRCPPRATITDVKCLFSCRNVYMSHTPRRWTNVPTNIT